MNQIVAFQCQHGRCRKIYDNRKQAKAHEKKCYFNPATRSCASCENFVLSTSSAPEKPLHTITEQKCLKGVDVSHRKLRTACPTYVERQQVEQ